MEWLKSMQNNFKQAVKEVFFFNTDKMSKNHDKNNGNNQPKGSVLKANGENTGSSAPPNEKGIVKKIIEKPVLHKQNSYSETSIRAVTKNETAFITESTIIQGNIITDSNIVIAGEIQGNIESKNTVVANGKVCGDIKCKDAEINGANIEGNINALEALMIGKDSIIAGNVSANSGKINGKIKGNVAIKFDVEIPKNAYIIGEITANSISVENGAIIQGGLNVLGEEAQIENELSFV
jgi:cytoskeletal protein CcmA (bactofilin family)